MSNGSDNDQGQPDGNSGGGEARLTPHGRCPMCRSPGVAHYRPFCSKRCADADLARWLTGSYAIPGGDADDDEDGDAAWAAIASAKGETPDEDE